MSPNLQISTSILSLECLFISGFCNIQVILYICIINYPGVFNITPTSNNYFRQKS